ncbi:MAG: hypothetical protein ACXV5F_08570 [Halobacteriota archaeon]
MNWITILIGFIMAAYVLWTIFMSFIKEDGWSFIQGIVTAVAGIVAYILLLIYVPNPSFANISTVFASKDSFVGSIWWFIISIGALVFGLYFAFVYSFEEGKRNWETALGWFLFGMCVTSVGGIGVIMTMLSWVNPDLYASMYFIEWPVTTIWIPILAVPWTITVWTAIVLSVIVGFFVFVALIILMDW